MSEYEKRKTGINPQDYGLPDNIPNELCVPSHHIFGIPTSEFFLQLAPGYVESLKGQKKRSWMNRHAYFCLPLQIANETGFIIRAPFEIDLYWSGGEEAESLKITPKPT